MTNQVQASVSENASKGKPELLSRSGFAMAPLRLMEDCRTRKGTLFVYLWLWHHAGIANQAFPSLQKLSLECGMKAEDTREAIWWLCEEGWVERIERPGFTTLFHVRTEHRHPYPKRGTPPPKGGYPKRGTTPLPQKGEDTNKNQRTKKLKNQEPPFVFPPSGGSAASVATHDQAGPCTGPVQSPDLDLLSANPDPSLPTELHQMPLGAPVSVQKQPIQPIPPWGPQEPLERLPAPSPREEPKKPKAVRFQPTEADIPAILLPVALPLLDFWAVKAGKKTQKAWDALLKELHKIWDDTAGGTDVLRRQLEMGIEAKTYGNGWQSITYANWLKYGKEWHRRKDQPRLTENQKTSLLAVAKIRAMEAAKNQATNPILEGASL